MVGEHRLHLQVFCQLGYHFLRSRMVHDQAHTFGAVGAPKRPQAGVKLDQGVVDEFHPPVGFQPALQQRLQDVGVKDKDAPKLPARLQRVEKGGVVVHPQIAAEPHQTSVVAVHGAQGVSKGLARSAGAVVCQPLKIQS
jgi:hypothetical protein